MLTPLTITDHRGRDVPFMSAESSPSLAERLSRPSAIDRKSLTRSIRRLAPIRERIAWGLLSTAVLLLWWWFSFRMWHSQTARIAATFAGFIAIGAILFRARVRRLRRRYRGLIVDAVLQAGRCPSCRYDLRAIPEADDRCRICPECGAAWRIA